MTEKQSSKIIKAKVLRDYWKTEEETSRVRAGTVIEVDADTMIEGLESGVLERVKG